MARIGFIGLGHMGMPMAHNLLKGGHDLFVYDIAPQGVDQLVTLGATRCQTLAAIAEQADTVITMLQTGAQVRAVTQGKEGLLAHLKPERLYLECSTIDVATSREIHQQAQARNIAMLDAPVSGGVIGAEAATLTFMVGGEAKTFARAKPLLELMGKNIIHAGAAGNGQVAKICNNMILGVSMIAVSEAFALGEKLGLDAKTFYDISSQSSGQCWSMTSYCPAPGLVEAAPSNRDYEAGFTANMMLKDLRLSQRAATEAKATTPLGAQATKVYKQFTDEGHGDLDFSGIIKMIEQGA
jgi:3-hydroxyisobutyrate dehydrogenase